MASLVHRAPLELGVIDVGYGVAFSQALVAGPIWGNIGPKYDIIWVAAISGLLTAFLASVDPVRFLMFREIVKLQARGEYFWNRTSVSALYLRNQGMILRSAVYLFFLLLLEGVQIALTLTAPSTALQGLLSIFLFVILTLALVLLYLTSQIELRRFRNKAILVARFYYWKARLAVAYEPDLKGILGQIEKALNEQHWTAAAALFWEFWKIRGETTRWPVPDDKPSILPTHKLIWRQFLGKDPFADR